MDRVLDRDLGGWQELTFVRLVLPIPYNLVGLARELSFRQYFVVTFLTASIPNVFEVGFGAGLIAGQWTEAAIFAGLTALGVAALLTRRSIRDTLMSVLRSKLGAKDRSQDRHTPGEKNQSHDLWADARFEGDDSS